MGAQAPHVPSLFVMMYLLFGIVFYCIVVHKSDFKFVFLLKPKTLYIYGNLTIIVFAKLRKSKIPKNFLP